MSVVVEDEGGLTATTSFEVTVSPVNDPPVGSPISNQSTPEDATLGPVSFTSETTRPQTDH